MPHPLSDQELLDYSGDHLIHELTMLDEAAEALQRHEKGTTEYVALIESFAVHLRNLIEFLYFLPKGEYVRAAHYFADQTSWSPKTTPEIERLLDRANNEVAHLTTGRVNGSPEAWNVGQIRDQIIGEAQTFARNASRYKLNKKVLEFLELPTSVRVTWAMANCPHPNVATYTGTVKWP